MAIMWREYSTGTIEKVFRPGLVARVMESNNRTYHAVVFQEVANSAAVILTYSDGSKVGLPVPVAHWEYNRPTKESAMQWADNKAREL